MRVGEVTQGALRFADEIQAAPESAGAKKAATSRELEMALKLIDEMTEKWHPEQFHNTYKDDLMKRIQEKVKSGNVTVAVAEDPGRGPA